MTDSPSRFRLGIDIGGTFTDATLIDEATGDIRIGKVPTTPRDPSRGFLEATRRILGEAGIRPADVGFLVHATTVATNAIIEEKIAPTGFITTDGFRDILEIARQIRPSLYDLQFEKPRPLVPRYRCFGVPERLDARGEVLLPLDEDAVRRVALALRQDGVESIALCFLHAYLNPSHERRAGEIVREAFPEAFVSLSSEVAPEFREYFRASTTVINAALQPVIARYLESIEARLREDGLLAELLVMQSNGGVFTFAAAREKPVFMVESGPAAGVVAATYLGTALGYRDVISFDMGGTTAKAGLIQDGVARVTKDYEVGAAARAGVGSARGSGYPIRTPVVDLVEIGAGGGSIAWVDSGGGLRVGPRSAGADPGPACYGRGGDEPTITDADLVLGRLNPDFFLGGDIRLDVDRARRAIQSRCADPLGLDIVTVALGIVEIANAAMVNALRLVSVQRGYDPRNFVLIAFGGAGPVHANRLAAEIEIPTMLIPLSPGITSALGLLVTDLKHDYSTTLIQRVDRLDLARIEETFQAMIAQGRTVLAREGVRDDDVGFVRQVEMRYVGQGYELGISLPEEPLDSAGVDRIVAQFHVAHDRAYGYSAPSETAEFVNLRLTAVGRIAKPPLRRLPVDNTSVADARKSSRPVYFAESNGFVDCPIYDRYKLPAGGVLAGPAVIEEFDSTTVIHPGHGARVDEFGNLVVTPLYPPRPLSPTVGERGRTWRVRRMKDDSSLSPLPLSPLVGERGEGIEGASPFGMVIAKDVMVPMRDGVRLAADIYRPARDGEPVPGRFPTILGRTSYDKNSPQMWVEPVGEFFCRYGYIVVIQDLRGRHHSEGTGQYFHTVNPNEGPDGYDTIEWIAGRPWSNGRVGMVGSSHGAIVQQVAALYDPPHLSAIWPDVGPTNIYAHEAREGGAMQLHMFGAQFLHAHDAQEIRDDPVAMAAIARAMENLRSWVERLPLKPGHTPLSAVPNLEKTVFEYYYRGAYDEFWAQDCCDQERYFDRHADVPGVYSGGWYDPFAIATTTYYAAMAKKNATAQRLLMGPWNHGAIRGPGSTFVGDVDFGAAAHWGDAVYNAERLRWFDRWLKDIPNDVDGDPPVRIFVMGGGTGRKTPEGHLSHGGVWRSEREWPLARARETPFYLRSGGGLTTEGPAGDDAPAHFVHDPDHPVPTIAGSVTGFYELVPIGPGMNPFYVTPRSRMRSIVLDGGAHQKEEPGIVGARPPYLPLATRLDVLVFQTEPLAEAIEVTGPILVKLWIASSAVDTDFTAKLVDVYPANPDYPDGYHLNLVDSIIRTRYRSSWEWEELMTTGVTYLVQIQLPPTSNLFAAGHRIRLDVSSSNFPRFDINPNTGEPIGRHTHSIVAHNTVFLDREHPSHVVLPVIPHGSVR